MKLNSILAGVIICGAVAVKAGANVADYTIITTNTFTLSGTYSYDALTTNGTINEATGSNVVYTTVTHGGNLLGKKSSSVTSYTTNITDVTVLSTASFALKDFLAAVNTDLTNNSSLYNFLTNASLTTLPAATKLQVVTEVDENGDNFNIYAGLVIPAGSTNIYYSLNDSSMFQYQTEGDYVFSKNLSEVLTSSGSTFTGALEGIVPVSVNFYSTPNCMPHAELDLYAIATGTLNFNGSTPSSVAATTTFTLSPLSGNIYVRDAHFHKVTGVFNGSASGSGTGAVVPE